MTGSLFVLSLIEPFDFVQTVVLTLTTMHGRSQLQSSDNVCGSDSPSLFCVYCDRFFATSAVLVYLYHAFFHGVEEEEFGGLWEIVKEGMMTSFALFLVLPNFNHKLLQ